MLRIFIRLLLLIYVLASASVVQASGGRLTLTGSSTIAPLILEVAKRFESQHPGVRINVQTGGSSRGINDVRLGLADIGMVSRALKASEKDLSAYLIARDGIGIITHKNNPVRNLTGDQIVGIYSGKIRNWEEVGGSNLPITVINKAEGRSTLELFLQHFSLRNSQINAQVVIGDNQQGIKSVSAIAGAIGYVSIGTAEYEENHGTPIKLISMEGEIPTSENVAKGRYQFSRQLNLVVRNTPVGLAKEFIAFAQSDAVKDIIEAQFFVAP
ncbi:phosphate ABC transporter substrate-binding protein [Microbulbifer thermotolerans]|nr:phosphate ABC transporter substrate-binding protein [Microbulbifer thermotolerans]MCX2783555.1 phosphate ABC transporter substrate-binding protein [Microbulbifer thermotolerans]MCX2832267.1 phosphate ABC transporter substrate-binding protein [Microbulbifer thermotolerans]WKT60403.1 phosphate ABC transporter substrate-binding protein [Microbulbifer thermotolerans]